MGKKCSFFKINYLRAKTTWGRIITFFLIRDDFHFLRKKGFYNLKKYSIPNWNYCHGKRHIYKRLYQGFLNGKKYIIKTDNIEEAVNEFSNYEYIKKNGGIKIKIHNVFSEIKKMLTDPEEEEEITDEN